jgi:hypothetical protein
VYVILAAAAQRLLTLLVMGVPLGFENLPAALLEWDGVWYRGIVADGYQVAGTPDDASNLAFFPFYPIASRLLSLLPFVTADMALLILGIGGSIVAAVPVYLIGKRLHSAGVGWVLALLWGAMPQSFVLVMGYPEGLFTAATAFALLYVIRKQPVAAACATAIAGLIRPSALPLIVVVMVWALLNAWRGERRWRWWVAAAVAPSGLAVYMLYIAYRTGSVFGYFGIQKAWNLRFGKPWELLLQARHFLTTRDTFLVAMDIYIPIVFAFVFLLILLAGRWREQGYFWIVAYTVLSTVLIVTRATFFWSESRQFLVLFPLLLPLATLKTSRWSWALVLIGATVASALFGGVFLDVHQYSP